MPIPNHVVRKLAICAFLLRGAFYCVEQPIWEGFDEWAHFGYIQHLAQYGVVPSRSDPVSHVLQRSVELVPLAASAAEFSTGSLTHDAFWRLPLAERFSRQNQLRALHRNAGDGLLMQYEAQQPPLYYLLLLFPYLAVTDFSLPAQALTLRCISLMISAAGLLLCCNLASQVPACRRAAVPVLLLLASWPGLLVSLSRIGNDGLALTLGAAVLFSLFRVLRSGSGMRDWTLVGVMLGAGLLTKAYLLALVPLLPITALMLALRKKPISSRPALGCVLALALAGLSAGWWYINTWLATGTLSGEQIDAAAAPFGLYGKFAAIPEVRWLRVLDSAATTHIWTGGWSFLGARSWMYRPFEILAVVAGLGLVALAARLIHKARRRGPFVHGDARLLVAASAFVLFTLALGYSSIVIYLTRGMSTAIGWYLYGIVGAEGVLLASGFAGLMGTRRAAACVAGIAFMACALDLYTVNFVSAPYYAGLTAHLPSGPLSTFHLSDLENIGLPGVFARLALNEPAGIGPGVIAALWVGYLCGTMALIALSAMTMKHALLPKRMAPMKHTLN